MAWYHRVWNALFPERASREIERGLAFHVAERTDELIAGGMSPEAAAREAARRFGNRTLQGERTRDADLIAWLESVAADVRYALRALGRSPAFTAVALLSLALGIGANTAIFSLTNALLLKQLPVRDPGRLVQVRMRAPGPDAGEGSDELTNPLWEQIRDHATGFSGMFAFSDQRFNLTAGGVARRASGAVVSGGFFSVLGVRPAAGRLLQAGDDVRGCPAVAVVSDAFAQREYGGRGRALGRVLTLDGHPFQVVGVVEPAFPGIRVGSALDIYAPLCTQTILRNDPKWLDRRATWYLKILGRLAPGVTPAQAEQRLKSVAPAVFAATVATDWGTSDQREYLKSTFGLRPAATGLSDLRDRYGRALLILLAVVALVLLVACANIANLFQARAAARQRESAIRRAIGAGRGRLVRGLLTEAVLLSLAGGALGVVFAYWASHLLVRLLSTPGDPVWLDLSPDLRVLGVTVAVALVTALLFGLAPAWRTARVSPEEALRAGGRTLGRTRAQRGARTLVAAQMALSLLLVTVAGLLVGSFRALTTLDPGFRREGLLLVSADFGGTGLQGARQRLAQRELLSRLRALPGVASASASFMTPVSGVGWNDLILVAGHATGKGRKALSFFNAVSDRYFATAGTALLAGREVRESDGAGAARVAVVNEAFARRFFGKANPIGRTFSTPVGDTASLPIEVVGVVRSARYRSLNDDPPPTAYVPAAQAPDFIEADSYELRASGPPAALLPAVKREAAAVSPSIRLDVTTMSDQLSTSVARPRVLAMLSGFFGALALLLAVIGLYGTMAYSVTRRRSEIGVRMALGAASAGVQRMLLGEAARLVAAGAAVGLALALATTRLLRTFLFELTPTDPRTLAAALATLALAAGAAALLPARRAARMQPMEALRED